MLNQLKIAFILLLIFTFLTGFLYPVFVTGILQVIFPTAANGSLITENGKVIGSKLIGQFFNSPNYFWGRPSATHPYPYNAAASSGSNMGPLNPAFVNVVRQRIQNLKQFPSHKDIPLDLITASGSGLDPDISPEAAFYQVPRIAKARNIPEDKIESLINNQIQKRFLYIFGEPRVNVLALNLALDKLQSVSMKDNARLPIESLLQAKTPQQ